MGLSRLTASPMRLTPANWAGARVTVLLPVQGKAAGNAFEHAITCTVPAVASAQTKWAAREAALAQGQLILADRLRFMVTSQAFMDTPGSVLTLLVEISDPGQGNWRTYMRSTHESGLSQKPVNPVDPQIWTMPTGIPDLWDGESYDVRITATCDANVIAALSYEIH